MLENLIQIRSIEYGNDNLAYRLLFCDRGTLEIAVHPDKSVVVKSPYDTPNEKIDIIVRKRARWIIRQIRFFEKFEPRSLPRTYVTGESHLYLGRNYRLSFIDDINAVKLIRGRLIVPKTNNGFKETQSLMNVWYREKAKKTFNVILEEVWRKFPYKGLTKPSLSIRVLQKRWGSLSKAGTLTLNVDLIKTPKDCIEYVIVHELCHLIHYDHSSDFYGLLEGIMPEWKKQKNKLEMLLV